MLEPIRHIDPSSMQDLESLRDVVKLLLNIVEQQSANLDRLEQQNQELKDEINRLKGEQGRPKFPKAKSDGSNKDISSEKKRPRKNRKRGAKKPKINIDRTEYRLVDRSILPPDAQFKGYEDVVEQELSLVRRNSRYKIERYYSPSQGRIYRGALPPNYIGEFGVGLQSLIQVLHHVCDVTHGRLKALLKSQGIVISSGTISNILLSSEAWAVEEQRAILHSGIANSPYTQADGTKSKQRGKRKVTQIIGAQFFSVFYTMDSKSRLDVLRAFMGKPEEELLLCLNATSRALLTHFQVCQKDRQFLEQHFSQGKAWNMASFEDYLQKHAPHIRAKKNMYPRIVESMALGQYHEQTYFPEIDFLLSDDAGEYNKIARRRQALCWIHDARYYNKLTPKIEFHRSIKHNFQEQYWQFYEQLMDFKQLPPLEQKAQRVILEERFEELFKPATDYFQLNECIRRTYANKEKLLAVLDNPALPLHNNAAELGARRVVRKRDISLHTWSEKGTRVRDAFMSIVETAAKLGVNAMDYIADRITRKYQLPHLADLVQKAYC